MEEKRNYVIYNDDAEVERVVNITTSQANAIRWFMNYFNISGSVDLAENYDAEEI